MIEDLKPCPFCGSEAEKYECEDTDNKGGFVVGCTNSRCQASTKVAFGDCDNMLRSLWNRRI